VSGRDAASKKKYKVVIRVHGLTQSDQNRYIWYPFWVRALEREVLYADLCSSELALYTLGRCVGPARTPSFFFLSLSCLVFFFVSFLFLFGVIKIQNLLNLNILKSEHILDLKFSFSNICF
jgi:hypothetical protein